MSGGGGGIQIYDRVEINKKCIHKFGAATHSNSASCSTFRTNGGQY